MTGPEANFVVNLVPHERMVGWPSAFALVSAVALHVAAIAVATLDISMDRRHPTIEQRSVNVEIIVGVKAREMTLAEDFATRVAQPADNRAVALSANRLAKTSESGPPPARRTAALDPQHSSVVAKPPLGLNAEGHTVTVTVHPEPASPDRYTAATQLVSIPAPERAIDALRARNRPFVPIKPDLQPVYPVPPNLTLLVEHPIEDVAFVEEVKVELGLIAHGAVGTHLSPHDPRSGGEAIPGVQVLIPETAEAPHWAIAPNLHRGANESLEKRPEAGLPPFAEQIALRQTSAAVEEAAVVLPSEALLNAIQTKAALVAPMRASDWGVESLTPVSHRIAEGIVGGRTLAANTEVEAAPPPDIPPRSQLRPLDSPRRGLSLSGGDELSPQSALAPIHRDSVATARRSENQNAHILQLLSSASPAPRFAAAVHLAEELSNSALEHLRAQNPTPLLPGFNNDRLTAAVLEPRPFAFALRHVGPALPPLQRARDNPVVLLASAVDDEREVTNIMRPFPLELLGIDPISHIEAIASQLECGKVDTHYDASDGKVILTGYVRSAADRGVTLARLSEIIGPGAVEASDLRVIAEPFCRLMLLLDRPEFSRSEEQVADILEIGNSAPAGVRHMFAGRSLEFEFRAPGFPNHMYIDYFLNNGRVYHLLPVEQTTGNQFLPGVRFTIGGDGADRKILVAPPFGVDVVLSLGSSADLFDEARPRVEPASRYLLALQSALDRAKRADDALRLEYFYHLIDTGSAE